MTMLRDEMSGKNDPYKKPIGTVGEVQGVQIMSINGDTNIMTGQEWYDRFLAELQTVYPAVEQVNGMFWALSAARRAANLTDKENTQ